MSVETSPPPTTSSASTDTEVRLFLSHKAEDALAASEIRKHLVFLGQKRLRVFVKESDGVPFGTEYRPRTLQELAQADKLILLYTDPDQEWDVCLYESGFFDGKLFPDSTRRLIVLHDEAIEPPEPLSFFHAVKVSRNQRDPLRKFIYEVYATSPRFGVSPINPELMDEQFAEYRKSLEEAIITAVCGPQEIQVFAREIRIEVLENKLKESNEVEIPDQARFFGDQASVGLLGLRGSQPSYEWPKVHEAMDQVTDHTADWIASLALMMQRIAFSEKSLPSTGLPLYRFKTNERTEVYRPAIRSFRRKRGMLSFKVLFTDLPRETTVEPPGAPTILAQALTAARMFRWGVLKQLDDRVKELNKKLEATTLPPDEWFGLVAKELRKFFGQKLTVLVEAFNRGYLRKDLLDLFEKDRRSQLDQLFFAWDQMCEQAKELADKFEERSGTLQEINQMTELSLRLNKELMVLCAERYLEALHTL